MEAEDVEAIAEYLFTSLNHPQNAAHKEGAVKTMRESPRKMDGFMFPIVDGHMNRKAFLTEGACVIPNLQQAYDAVIRRVLEKIDAPPTLA